jgi:hypothetical protein
MKNGKLFLHSLHQGFSLPLKDDIERIYSLVISTLNLIFTPYHEMSAVALRRFERDKRVKIRDLYLPGNSMRTKQEREIKKINYRIQEIMRRNEADTKECDDEASRGIENLNDLFCDLLQSESSSIKEFFKRETDDF